METTSLSIPETSANVSESSRTNAVVLHDSSRRISHSTADIATTSTGYLAHATSPQGSRVVGREVRDNDRIRTEAGEMLVSTALAHGFLRRDAAGKLVEVDSGDPSHPVNRKAAQNAERSSEAARNADADAIEVSAQTTTVLTNISTAARGAGINPASVVAEIVTKPGEVPPSVVKLCEMHGLSVDEARQELNATMRDLGMSLGQRFGIPVEDLDGFFEHVARSASPTTLAQLWVRTVFGGQSRQWAPYVEAWRIAGQKAAQRPKSNDGRPRDVGSDQVEITVNGSKRIVSRAFARSAGLV